MQNYKIIAQPLIKLLKKESFEWNPEQAFQSLKTAITSSPILRLPQFEDPFTIETDASNKGIRTVLMQENQPIAFISKDLNLRNQTKLVYKKMVMVVLYAVGQWRHYLEGTSYVIRTYQYSLKYLLDQRVSSMV